MPIASPDHPHRSSGMNDGGTVAYPFPLNYGKRMPIPVYTQEEADWMIGMEKVADYEAQIYSVEGRFRQGYDRNVFNASPRTPEGSQSLKFRIRTEANLTIEAYCILLEGSIDDKPMEGLCRYDVHDSLHRNNCICCDPPPEILPGEFHLHRYSECCIRSDLTWDKCGKLITIHKDQTFKMQIRSLIGLFLKDMRLIFSDSLTRNALFGSGEP